MNLVNKITISRILITPLFVVGLLSEGVFFRSIAILCFIYASLSDWVDGYLARKNNLITDFGKFLDPLADKIFISAAFICFVEMNNIFVPAWMVIIIISREFMITGLRTIAMSKGKVLPATKSGKFKTTSQLVFISVILIVLLISDLKINLSVNSMFILERIIPFILGLFVTLLTAISGISYLMKNKNLFHE